MTISRVENACKPLILQGLQKNTKIISTHAIVITGKISKIASSATQTKEGNIFEVTALATADKQDSSKLKYGLQGKTISTIGKKTFFNYYKDKLLKDF
ncbi:hypothetical protein AU078_04975 [Streptococcus gallolyticus]|nr:hypothetical protein AU078_04975 [Streptococcus gallolyticus]